MEQKREGALDRMQRLSKLYEEELLERVVPFWEHYSIDRASGGYLSCLDRDGTVYDTDKFTWMQARELWMFSRLARRFHRELPEDAARWLALAEHGRQFLQAHGRTAEGDWYFALDREGRPLVAAYNLFSDYFACAAFAEYAAAAEDRDALTIAKESFQRIEKRRENPKGGYTKQFGETRQMASMSVPMMDSWLLYECPALVSATDRERRLTESIQTILTRHVDEKRQLVFERVSPVGERVPGMNGRLLNPGHAMEGLWFTLRYATAAGLAEYALQLSEPILWMAERGWDHEYGGFYYYLDADGFPPEKLEWHMKLWWVHAEALCAFLHGFEARGDPRFLQWFERVHDWVFSHFPDPEQGEWYGYLYRSGDPSVGLKGGKWKGFFHIPRALLEIADRLTSLSQAAPGEQSQ